jgi:hypothetical protein
LFIFLKIFL